MNKKSIAIIIATVAIGIAIVSFASSGTIPDEIQTTENVEEIGVEENLETATEVADDGDGRQFTISLHDGITATSNP